MTNAFAHETSTDRVVAYVESFDMFKTARPAPVVHTAGVHVAPRGCRQPWIALCSCGWASMSYAQSHAAQIMADDHMANA